MLKEEDSEKFFLCVLVSETVNCEHLLVNNLYCDSE